MNWLELWRHTEGFLRGMLVKPPLPGAQTLSLELGSGYNLAAEEESIRRRIVDFMRSQMGKPYRLGAEVKPGQEDNAVEWDCSEATEAAYRTVGKFLPDGAQQQHDFCQRVVKPRIGDLGFLWSDKRKMIGHVMVASDHRMLIHAVGGRGVVEDPAEMWERNPRWRGWRRHIDFARPVEDRA